MGNKARCGGREARRTAQWGTASPKGLSWAAARPATKARVAAVYFIVSWDMGARRSSLTRELQGQLLINF